MAIAHVHVQAKAPNGSLVFDSTVQGKKYKKALIRSAMLALDDFAGIAVIRSQVVGANSWVYYRYECRTDHCEVDRAIIWE